MPKVYELIHRASLRYLLLRYLLVSDYYNPTSVRVVYRGHSGKVFRRDFAGDLLDGFPGLVLVDSGFVYHRGKAFPQDDMT